MSKSRSSCSVTASSLHSGIPKGSVLLLSPEQQHRESCEHSRGLQDQDQGKTVQIWLLLRESAHPVRQIHADDQKQCPRPHQVGKQSPAGALPSRTEAASGKGGELGYYRSLAIAENGVRKPAKLNVPLPPATLHLSRGLHQGLPGRGLCLLCFPLCLRTHAQQV